MSDLLPVSEEYLARNLTVKPGDRLHRLVCRLFDTHIDDLSDDEIEQVERRIDALRITHADGARFAKLRSEVTP